jgi:hypothetical protein
MREFLSAVGNAGQQAACASEHHEFVVAIAGTTSVRVEVGGCSRVIRDERGASTLGSADPSVIAGLLNGTAP